jgi:hypothetical protein
VLEYHPDRLGEYVRLPGMAKEVSHRGHINRAIVLCFYLCAAMSTKATKYVAPYHPPVYNNRTLMQSVHKQESSIFNPYYVAPWAESWAVAMCINYFFLNIADFEFFCLQCSIASGGYLALVRIFTTLCWLHKRLLVSLI